MILKTQNKSTDINLKEGFMKNKAVFIQDRFKDLSRRFDLVQDALDGLSQHDRFGILGGIVFYMLQRNTQVNECTQVKQRKQTKRKLEQ